MKGAGRIFRRRKKRPDGSIFEIPVWWIAYYYRGKEYRETSHSTSEVTARRILKKRLGEIGSGKLIGPIEEKVTFEQMALDLTRDYEINSKKSVASIKLSIAHLGEYFALTRAIDMTTDRIRAYISQRQNEITGKRAENSRRKRDLAAQLRQTSFTRPGQRDEFEQKASLLEAEADRQEKNESVNGSINRELSALKRMFALSIQAGKLSSRPYIPTLAENNARQGFLDHGSFLALKDALPQYLKDPVTFLYLSGWRVSEMRAIEARDYDRPGKVLRLRPEISKNKEGRILPVDDELFYLLERAWLNRRPACPYLFHVDGKPIGDFKKSWKTACNAVGLSGIIVHDLRRTAVRNMVRAGIQERVAMRLSGHKTRSVFDRYNIVSEADLMEARKKLSAHLQDQSQEAKVSVMSQKKLK